VLFTVILPESWRGYSEGEGSPNMSKGSKESEAKRSSLFLNMFSSNRFVFLMPLCFDLQ
jgi:hypothetical protein